MHDHIAHLVAYRARLLETVREELQRHLAADKWTEVRPTILAPYLDSTYFLSLSLFLAKLALAVSSINNIITPSIL